MRELALILLAAALITVMWALVVVTDGVTPAACTDFREVRSAFG